MDLLLHKGRPVIIVLGKVQVAADKLDEALKVSQAHVMRSRAEPGCISHGVSISAEQAEQLVFVEQWDSLADLKAHFAVPESRKFAAAISQLASTPPEMTIFESSPVKFGMP
ncbi:MAG: putative quinol monooxygenase [Rhodoferax sp.]